MKIGLPFLLILLFLAGCSNKQQKTAEGPRNSIISTMKKFNVRQYSYIIANENKVLEKEFNFPKDQLFANSDTILDNLTSPILLKLLFDTGEVNEQSLMATYVPEIADPSLKIIDLLKVRVNQTCLSPSREKDIAAYINTIIQKTKNHTTRDFQKQKLGIDRVKPMDCQSLLTDLATVSLYFDSKNVSGYFSDADTIGDLYPTWYTRNISYFAGWHVLKFLNHTVFWNYYTDGPKSLLLVKVIDTGLFMAVVYPSESLPSPFSYNRMDLMQSPLATAVFKQLFVPDSIVKIDFAGEEASIERDLPLIKSSPWEFLYINDLIANARTFERLKNSKRAQLLYRLYEKNFPGNIPLTYLNQPVLAELIYAPDYTNALIPFGIAQTTKCRVFGSGQVLADADPKVKLNQYDGVELYFDMYNKKNKLSEKSQFQSLYRFDYGCNLVSGDYLSDKDVKFAFGHQHHAYVLEVSIPWTTLGNRKPTSNMAIGFNVFVMDNDIGFRKSALSWSADKTWSTWNNPSRWGTWVLTNTFVPEKFKTTYGKHITQDIQIDGNIDKIWEETKYCSIDTLAEGLVCDKADNSARFKTLWNDHAAFFLIYVNDDIINPAGIATADKGWIENSSHQKLWETQDYLNTIKSIVYTVSDTLTLNAGRYLLNYTSDGGYAAEKWYGMPPQSGQYGLAIYKSVE